MKKQPIRTARKLWAALYLAFSLAAGLMSFEPRARASDGDLEIPPGADDFAQTREPPVQVYGGPRALVVGRSGDPPQALDTGWGFQVGATQFWKHAGVGAELRFARIDASQRLSARALEVVLKPAFGFTLERLPLRLYAAVPFGLSLSLHPRAGGYGGPSRADGVIGPALGATAFVSHRLGFNMEAGYQWIGPRNEPFGRRELALALNVVYGL
jgi:hypothetical protein